MNHARPMTSKQDRSYIQAYNEARRSQFAFKTVAAKSTSDPMYVDISGKEGKEGEKGKGDGKKGKKGGKGQPRISIRILARTLFAGTEARKAT